MSFNPTGPAGPPRGDHVPMGHAFISYVREDTGRVDQLQRALEEAGIPVWRDTQNLWPGEDWRAKIRQEIKDNAFVFIACFSRAGVVRPRSYQNEELTLAIEELRLRRPEDPWLIPVRLDECDTPHYDIGGGREFASIQRVDLFGDRSEEELKRLITAVSALLGGLPRDSLGRPWQRVVAAVFRKTVIVPLIVAVFLIAVTYAVLQGVRGQGGVTVTGSVVCESGRPVAAIWIAAASGQIDSGYAHLGPTDASGISYPIGPKGTYSFLLSHGGEYAVHVGCGGTADDWDSRNFSVMLSNPSAHLQCDDPTTAPVRGVIPVGTCTDMLS